MAAPRFQAMDVRDVLAAGGEPLPAILKRIELLSVDEGLMVVAPFLPSPLIRLLESEGFRARSERRSATEWRVYFWRGTTPNE